MKEFRVKKLARGIVAVDETDGKEYPINGSADMKGFVVADHTYIHGTLVEITYGYTPDSVMSFWAVEPEKRIVFHRKTVAESSASSASSASSVGVDVRRKAINALNVLVDVWTSTNNVVDQTIRCSVQDYIDIWFPFLSSLSSDCFLITNVEIRRIGSELASFQFNGFNIKLYLK